MNRLIDRTSTNNYQIAFAYDAAGNRTNMSDLSGTTSYTYDSRNRLLLKTQAWTGGPQISLAYTYDTNGNVSTIHSSTTNGVNLGYAYDALNRITNVLAGGSNAASYGFDANGNLQAVRYGNGATNVCQYDILNRLTSSVWKSNALTLASFYYQLGATGNRTNLTETLLTAVTNRTYAWAYDSLYRLASEGISGIGTNTYGLDNVGNRTSRTAGLVGQQNFSYSSNDWLTTDQYDSNGNTLSSTNGASVSGPYYYDVENHLINFSNAVYFGYNGDGIRVSKIANATNLFYLVADRNPTGYAQVLEEWAASGGSTNLAHVYNYGLGLISQAQQSTVYFLVPDAHGSTRLLTDGAASVANAFVYDAYGNIVASTESAQTVHLYCGEEIDPHLGFYYLIARYQDPNTGRFWTGDAFQGHPTEPISLHKYAYCSDNPINFHDPSGRQTSMAELQTTALIIAGLAAFGAGVDYELKTHALGNLFVALVRAGGTFGDINDVPGVKVRESEEAQPDTRPGQGPIDPIPPTLPGPPNRDPQCEDLIISISTSPIRDVATNILAAQTIKGQPVTLHRGLGTEAFRDANRNAALKGLPQAPPSYSWDEYPFASSWEGGAGAAAGLVPRAQQAIQGGIISGFYRSYGIKPGAPGDCFNVIITP